MSLESAVLAFIAGCAGTIIGGTQTFIATGFIGILVALLQHAGADATFLNDVVLNHFFLPCIIFNGAAVATAVASKKYDIRGIETYRSLAFTNDPLILISGGIAGLAGYAIYFYANKIGLNMDVGSLSVVLVQVVARLLLADKDHYINRNNLRRLKYPDWYALSYQLLFTVCISFAMAYFALKTKLYTIGFSISALSLIFSFTDSGFPSTHHITLVTGYAAMVTGNLWISVLFGVLAQVIFFLFAAVCNTDCETHIDPPAVAIAILSFVLFNFF